MKTSVTTKYQVSQSNRLKLINSI